MQPFTPQDVQAALTQHGLQTTIRFFETTTATSQQAADNIGCALGQIVKSLCFIVDDKPILVLASGDQRVDDRKLADHYGVGRKKVKVATADECIAVYGYAPGGVPPIGHRTPDLLTLIDDSLTRFEMLYAAGGAHNAIFPITLAQLIGATGGVVMDVKKEVMSDEEKK